MAKAQSKPKSKQAASKRGGKRAGAGRKSTEANKLRADFNAATNQTLVEWLPGILANLKRLADGGYERVELKYEVDPFDATKVVLVEKKVETAEPDRAANIYLADRLLGRPKQAVEHSGPEGGAIPVVFEEAASKVYGGEGGS